MHLKVSSAKRRPFCLGLNVLNGVAIKENSVFLYGVILPSFITEIIQKGYICVSRVEVHRGQIGHIYFNFNFPSLI